MTDLLVPFMFEQADIRGSLVQLDASLSQQLQAYDYPVDVANLLGEANAASCLLAASLKLQGRLGLQLQGSGSVRLLLAQVNDRLELRSLARFEADSQGSWSQLVGSGVLALNLEPEQGQRYQGLVSLDGQNLAQCIETYFAQSEQLTSHLYLFSRDGKAAGLLLQAMPVSADRNLSEQAESLNRLHCLASTLSADEALSLPPLELLHRLFHQESCRVFSERPVRFVCGCSRDKTSQALRALPKTELQSLLTEQGQAELHCDYCQSCYRFDAVDLAGFIQDSAPASPIQH